MTKISLPPTIKIPDGFVLESMKIEDYDDCIELAATCFCNNNPLCVALGMSETDFRRTALKTIRKKATIESELSLLIRQKESRKIVAFMFNEKMDLGIKYPMKELNKISPHTETFIELVEKCYEIAFEKSSKLAIGSLLSGKCLHAAMGGTDPKFEGLGLAKCLRRATLDVAVRKGFNTVIVEAGHGATAHVWEKYIGGVICSKIEAASFTSKKGNQPWKDKEAGHLTILQTKVRKNWRDSKIMRSFYLAKAAILL